MTIRTVVADDSPAFRQALITVLGEDPTFQVVGTAGTGEDAVRRVRELRPNLVVMDVQMPGMTGVAATAAIMSEAPCAIVVMSGLMQTGGQQVAFEALRAGAVDAIGKPRDLNLAAPRQALRTLLRAMAEVRVVRRRGDAGSRVQPVSSRAPVQLVALGASTGGPPALREVLRHLPAQFPAPLLVAQHLAAGFSAGLRQWLAESTALQVVRVTTPVLPLPGTLYLPDEGCDLLLRRGAVVSAPSASLAVPSVDRMFRSLLDSPRGVVAVMLTGMGRDGADALLELRQRGARTVAQDEETALIDGMPRAARELGAAEATLGLPAIGRWLCDLAGVAPVEGDGE